uniref:Uncharacterized protein n=1 Tax=Chromera velia CCMP2878 TaxID=1169474 RepID=A0A0G4G7H5_9ALVE|eukprot:Cvel_4281.t1-p1 / transcript=Cvel_4281.t1 / gene=Cvel_4281 / organism=Chromera_velia_CCMP2878 / gene_product=hypothetical protein / transcript_product=hypothetical protein / location=Cvel_scaffold185:86163-88930(-) / protein_length=741 / sequence_SO=supercontig / SO=protein_coding / is_pseudo=false
MGPKKDAPHGCIAIKGMEAKTVGVFGLTDDADIIEWVWQYADVVAILGDSDKWCSRLTLTNRNKVGVNIKHYVARTEVEVLEKVVERVPHLSLEISEQLQIFTGTLWTTSLRPMWSGELHGGASTETKVKMEEETGAIPDTSRQMSVPVSSEQRPASDKRDRRSSSSSSSSGEVQVADKLRKEIDVLSPPHQAKGITGGAAEGRLPSVFQMTPLTGGGVYPADSVSPPEPAMVSVGGRVRTGDVGALGAPDIFFFLGVRESSGTQGRPKYNPEDPLIAYTLEKILTSVPRTFVKMRDKVVAMIFAHFFKTIQYSTSALVLEYERIACKPCRFGTYTELLAHHKRLLNYLVEENIVYKLGVKYRLGLLMAHLPNDLIMRWQERQNPVDLTSEVEIIKEIHVIAAQAETFNKSLSDAWDRGLVKGALVEDLKREWEQKATTFGVRDSGGASRGGIIPKVPFVAFAGPGGVLQRKSPSKAKGGKPSGGKTPDSGGKGRGNSNRGKQGSAGGGFSKGDGGGSSNWGRSPRSNSSAPSSRYNDKGVEGKDRPPTQAVVNPRSLNRNPVLDRYGVRHRDGSGLDAFIGTMAEPGETPIKPGQWDREFESLWDKAYWDLASRKSLPYGYRDRQCLRCNRPDGYAEWGGHGACPWIQKKDGCPSCRTMGHAPTSCPDENAKKRWMMKQMDKTGQDRGGLGGRPKGPPGGGGRGGSSGDRRGSLYPGRGERRRWGSWPWWVHPFSWQLQQ